MESKYFKDWIKTEWSLQGGLITPAIAYKILGITSGGIASLQKKKNINEIKLPDGKTMLSYAEIMKMAEDREKNGVRHGRKRKARKNAVSVELNSTTEKTKDKEN